MTISDTLEEGLAELDELEWDLGGYRPTIVYDKGLDGPGEVRSDDQDGPGDGIISGRQSIDSRAITLGVLAFGDGDDDAAQAAGMAATIKALDNVLTPLPDRYDGLRLLRWRRKGEPAKRIWYRPGPGEPHDVPGDDTRLLYNAANVLAHIEAPVPYRMSDVLHTVTLPANTEVTVVNAGSLCPIEPNLCWSLSCDNASGLILTNITASASWKFPAGPVTVSDALDIDGPDDSYGLVYGPGSTLFPKPMGLRPGNNVLKASADTTFSWRDTY